jgi:hypothetical protein
MRAKGTVVFHRIFLSISTVPVVDMLVFNLFFEIIIVNE